MHGDRRIEIRFGVLRQDSGQHISIGVSSGTLAPIGVNLLTVDIAVAWLLILGALPVEAEFGRVRTPNLGDVIAQSRKPLVGIEGVVLLVAAGVDQVGDTVAPAGQYGQLIVYRVVEDVLVVHTQRGCIDLCGISILEGNIQVRVGKHKFVGKSRAEHLG